jgi:glycosyltransferase involved in cell wall biosynthesis
VSRRRILALSPIPEEGAGCRFRVSQFAPALARAGFDLTIHPLFDTAFFRLVYKPGHYLRKTMALASRTLDRIAAVRSSGSFDAVLIYREAYPIGPPLIERSLARRGLPIVYDFDDAVFLPNTSEANQAIGSLKNPGKVAEILKLSTHVIAGNSYLADFAQKYARDVSIVPTCVDTTVWRPRPTPRPNGAPLVIGWIGTPTTTPYLLGLKDVFVDVAKSREFVLRVSGSMGPVDIPGVRVENVPWTLSGEVDLFNTCDIGVYPLPDDKWTRGKCGFKAIQFMSCGVPVIASPVGVNREIVTHGVDGLCAATPDEWTAGLRELLDNAGTRESLGAAGRRTIERAYSLAANAPRLVSVFERVTGDVRRRAS